MVASIIMFVNQYSRPPTCLAVLKDVLSRSLFSQLLTYLVGFDHPPLSGLSGRVKGSDSG